MSIVELCDRLASLPCHAGRRFPAEIRRALIDHAAQARRAGVAWSAIARQTGVPVVTLRRLHTSIAPPARPAVPRLVPVVTTVGEPPLGVQAELILRMPSGVALHGLSLQDAVRLLQVLA